MHWAFFGTDEFATIILDELKEKGFTPLLIICAPDMPMRRKHGLVPPPTKLWAQEHSIPFLQPEKLDTSFKEALRASEWNFFIVASYGKIIPQSVLDIPRKGTLNVHPSLLPQYRGASPVESAILDDTKSTGVTIMEMDAQMDHGPILAQTPHHFTEWPQGPEARRILAHVGGKTLAENITPWLEGTRIATEQDHTRATYTKKFEKKDAEIDMAHGDPYTNFRIIQAFHDWYNAFFFVEKNNRKIRIVVRSASYNQEGLHIHSVIPEGKKEMTWEQFQNFLAQ